jgi:hypothetical protein
VAGGIVGISLRLNRDHLLLPLVLVCRIDQFNNAINGFLRSKALLQAT